MCRQCLLTSTKPPVGKERFSQKNDNFDSSADSVLTSRTRAGLKTNDPTKKYSVLQTAVWQKCCRKLNGRWNGY